MRLTSFFALFEDAGEEPLLDRTIRERAGSEVFDALVYAGALVAAASAPSWECGNTSAEGCVRRVVLNDADAKRPLIAVCGNAERLCENVSLTQSDVARHRASREGLERLVAKLFAIDGQASAGPHPLRKIGEQIHNGAARDVFIAWNPGDPALSAVLALRGALHAIPSSLFPQRHVCQPSSRSVMGRAIAWRSFRSPTPCASKTAQSCASRTPPKTQHRTQQSQTSRRLSQYLRLRRAPSDCHAPACGKSSASISSTDTQ